MIHGVKDETFAVRADQDKLLFAAAYELSDSNTLALRQRISRKPIRLLAAFIGAQVVSILKVDRIDSGKRDELFKIDAAVSFGLKAFEFLFRNTHILIFGVLKAADEIIAFDNQVAHRAIILIAYSRAALFVQQVER